MPATDCVGSLKMAIFEGVLDDQVPEPAPVLHVFAEDSGATPFKSRLDDERIPEREVILLVKPDGPQNRRTVYRHEWKGGEMGDRRESILGWQRTSKLPGHCHVELLKDLRAEVVSVAA